MDGDNLKTYSNKMKLFVVGRGSWSDSKSILFDLEWVLMMRCINHNANIKAMYLCY